MIAGGEQHFSIRPHSTLKQRILYRLCRVWNAIGLEAAASARIQCRQYANALSWPVYGGVARWACLCVCEGTFGSMKLSGAAQTRLISTHRGLNKCSHGSQTTTLLCHTHSRTHSQLHSLCMSYHLGHIDLCSRRARDPHGC